MTPKEKALRLCQDFAYLGMESEQTNYYTLDLELAKRCALLAVDEIDYQLRTNIPNGNHTKRYWIEVKQEIEKL